MNRIFRQSKGMGLRRPFIKEILIIILIPEIVFRNYWIGNV